MISWILIRLGIWNKHDETLSLSSALLVSMGAAVVASPTPWGLGALIVAAGLYGHRRVGGRLDKTHSDTLKTIAEQSQAAAEKLAELERLNQRMTIIENRTRPVGGR